MGARTKMYKVQRKDLTLDEAYRIVQEIKSNLVEGEKIKNYLQFSSSNIDQIEDLTKNWVLSNDILLLRFDTQEIDAVNQIILNADKYFNIHFFADAQNESDAHLLGYTLNIDIEKGKLRLYINLPYSKEIHDKNRDIIKSKLITLLTYLIECRLIYIEKNEVEIIVHNLIGLSSIGMKGSWSYRDRLELSARGSSFPANIALSFEEKDIGYCKSIEKFCANINSALWNYFEQANFFLKGHFVTKTPNTLVDFVKQLSISKQVSSSLSIDLLRNPNFPLLEFLKKNDDTSLIVDDFTWKDSNDSSTLYNRIFLFTKHNGEFELSIGLDQDISDDYYHKIEDLIFDELIFTNYY
ncbi:MAG: hypothetical protein AAF806_21215 [Bacteroidota bacterium]